MQQDARLWSTIWAPWMIEANRLIGEEEIPGPRHNSVIVRLWETIKLPFLDDETPWCAAYVGHCLEVGQVPSTRRADARSYLKWGQQLLAPDMRRVTDIPYGAIVVLNRPGSSWSGHVGFFVRETHFTDGAGIVLLGGNQDNRVGYSSFRLSRVIGWRWPKGRQIPPVEAGRQPPSVAGIGVRPGRSEA